MYNKNKFYIKTTLLIFGLNVLFYFIIKLVISNYNMIGFEFENQIPFVKDFIWVYNLWYPFQILSLYIIFKYDKKGYLKTIIALICGLLISYVFFIAYPTIVTRPIVDTYHTATEFLLYYTYKLDYPVNCFPSVHCLICFTLIFNIIKNNNLPIKFRYIAVILNILIIASTLLIKQHVVIDIIGALIISIITYILVTKIKYFKQLQTKLKNQLVS